MDELRNQVIDKLIRDGCNPDEARRMVLKYYEYAARKYKTIKTISECIIILSA